MVDVREGDVAQNPTAGELSPGKTAEAVRPRGSMQHGEATCSHTGEPKGGPASAPDLRWCPPPAPGAFSRPLPHHPVIVRQVLYCHTDEEDISSEKRGDDPVEESVKAQQS